MKAICANCRQPFDRPHKHPKQKCCSVACRDALRTQKITRPCSTCGREVTRPKKRAGMKNAYCSKLCEAAYRREHGPRGESHVQHKPKVEVRCFECGRLLCLWPSKVKPRNYCGKSCFEKWQRESGYMQGENSPTWNGGHSDYRGPNWDRQRIAALERDGYRCVGCRSELSLQVHHKIPFNTFTDYREANDLSNLETLCNTCHTTKEWTRNDRIKRVLSASSKRWPARASHAKGRGAAATV